MSAVILSFTGIAGRAAISPQPLAIRNPAMADELAAAQFFIDTGRPLQLRHLPFYPFMADMAPRAELIDLVGNDRAGQGGLRYLAHQLRRHSYTYRLGSLGIWEKI